MCAVNASNFKAKCTYCTEVYLGCWYIKDVEFTALLLSVSSVPAIRTKSDNEPTLGFASPIALKHLTPPDISRFNPRYTGTLGNNG